MGTTSSFFGGGGGGGDPQGTFLASENVTSGDLVALNANGTVKPVISNDIAADATQSNDGNKLISSEPYYYNGPGIYGVHDSTLDKYLFVGSEGSNYNYRIKHGTYSDSTGEYTLTTGGAIGSARAGWLSSKYTTASNYLFGYHQQSSGQKYVRGVYWNGSSWAWTQEISFGYSLNDNSSYISANGDGSSDYTFASFDTSTRFCVSKGTWNGTSSTPTATQSLATTERTYTSLGSAFSPTFCGTHVAGDIHVFGLAYNYNSLNTMYLVTARAGQSNTTFKNNDTQLSTAPGYVNSIAYDPIKNVGVVVGKNSSSTKVSLGAFSVNQSTAEITYLGDLVSDHTAAGGITITFSPHTKKFVMQGWDQSTVETFSLSSDGVVSDKETITVHPAGSLNLRGTGLFPVTDSANIGINFTSQTNPTSNYIDTLEHGYVTQLGLAYLDTNFDSYIGQASEDITSSSAGAVALSKRETDFAGSSFQKGQKMYADASGSSFATSGTYLVGYAKDSDTVLVTGDPT